MRITAHARSGKEFGKEFVRQEDVKKSIFKICGELCVKKIAPGCRINDCWGVGKHLGSKIKSRKPEQINFFTSSRRDWYFRKLFPQSTSPV
jgi:hypothetical protein